MFMVLDKYSTGNMATVIGIFENCKKKKPFNVVVNQEVKQETLHMFMIQLTVCYRGLENFKKCEHYSILNKKSYSIHEVAKLFKSSN